MLIASPYSNAAPNPDTQAYNTPYSLNYSPQPTVNYQAVTGLQAPTSQAGYQPLPSYPTLGLGGFPDLAANQQSFEEKLKADQAAFDAKLRADQIAAEQQQKQALEAQLTQLRQEASVQNKAIDRNLKETEGKLERLAKTDKEEYKAKHAELLNKYNSLKRQIAIARSELKLATQDPVKFEERVNTLKTLQTDLESLLQEVETAYLNKKNNVEA